MYEVVVCVAASTTFVVDNICSLHRFTSVFPRFLLRRMRKYSYFPLLPMRDKKQFPVILFAIA